MSHYVSNSETTNIQPIEIMIHQFDLRIWI